MAPLPWQNRDNGRKYGSPICKRDFKNATDNLHVIGEKRQSQFLNKIRLVISTAEYIYFLGFGFDDENLDMLGDNFSSANLVWGTAFHLGNVRTTKAEANIKKRKVSNSDSLTDAESKKRVCLMDKSIDAFLKEHVVLR